MESQNSVTYSGLTYVGHGNLDLERLEVAPHGCPSSGAMTEMARLKDVHGSTNPLILIHGISI